MIIVFAPVLWIFNVSHLRITLSEQSCLFYIKGMYYIIKQRSHILNNQMIGQPLTYRDLNSKSYMKIRDWQLRKLGGCAFASPLFKKISWSLFLHVIDFKCQFILKIMWNSILRTLNYFAYCLINEESYLLWFSTIF